VQSAGLSQDSSYIPASESTACPARLALKVSTFNPRAPAFQPPPPHGDRGRGVVGGSDFAVRW